MSIQTKVNDLTSRRQAIESGKGSDAGDGKVHARSRIHMLLDENSFVETGMFVTQRATDFNLKAKALPADGVVCGYGTINGRLVYVYSQDSSVLGGAIGEMHAKKIVSVYDMALKTGAPLIGILDSAGLRLQESTDALDAFGQIYVKQSMVSGVIPQIAAVVGNCGGGSAVMTSLSDFTFMTKEKSHLYVNSPNTYGDQPGDLAEYADAAFNANESGLADFICDDEVGLFGEIRELVELLPANNKEEAPFTEVTDDINRVSEELAATVEDGLNGLAALSYLADNSKLLVVRATYADEVVTCLGKMNGMTVGFIANETTGDQGRLTVKGLEKVKEFITLCDAFSIPLLTLVDVFGYEASLSEEKAGLAKAAARLSAAFVSASVPKISVIAHRAYGSAYVSFNSKHIGADIVYAWPTAKISMMDAGLAARIMYADEINASESASELIAEKTALYAEVQASPYAAASRGYVDDIIEPAATRKRVIAALEMLYTKNVPFVDRKHPSI